MKASISFVCQECGYDSPQWLGKCPECGQWNSFREIKGTKTSGVHSKRVNSSFMPKTLNQISYEEKDRLTTGFTEVDSVLGGGIVKGSVSLLAGDPGIGKSTLLLQMGLFLSNKHKILYISGEESEEQVKLRAKRIGDTKKNGNFLLLSTNDTNGAVEAIEKIKPAVAIIDSIQTMESEDLPGLSGSIGQVRYAASLFIRVAKTLGIPVIIVGHVTKEGMVAGPMILSHMVDTVLFFEGEKFTEMRILRSLKNRFGPVDEVGMFMMREEGIKQVDDSQRLFLTDRDKNIPGSVIVVTLEGTRAIPVEIQALALYSKLPLPRHVCAGIDPKRLELLLAVLQKHCGLPLGAMDVFVNVAGGLKLADPAIDLGVCLAIFSSFKNIPLSNTVCIAEVGLLGELRNVVSLEKRIKEAEELGFKKIISTKNHKALNEVIRFLSKK